MIGRKKLCVLFVLVAVVAVSFFGGALLSSFNALPLTFQRFQGFAQPESANPSEQMALKATNTQERMVVYDGRISLETSNIQAVVSKISAVADEFGGYVAGTSFSLYGAQTVADITVRVPKDRFHAAVQEIRGLGKVLDERTKSDDVTQQYVDMKARLENLQRQEKRLNEILGIAKTVSEVLNVEKELERVRGEIESLQGQINYTERNVEMSTITSHLTEPNAPFKPSNLNLNETLGTALTGLFLMIRALVIITITILPLMLIAIPAYYLHIQRKRKAPK